MIRLVASDMDGTFVSYDGTVSEANIKAVRRMKDEGVIFTAASGRNREGIMQIFSPYELKVECICANGAQYADEEGNLISEAYLCREKGEKVVEVFRRNHVPFLFFAADGVYCFGDPETGKSFFVDRAKRRFGQGTTLTVTVENMKEVKDLSEIHVMKIEGYDMEPDLLKKVREEMRAIEGINALSAAVDNLEVTDVLASKGKILMDACKRKGILPEEVLVLGDGLNDLSLFELFPHSAAIGKAAEELVKLAEFINPDDHEGFAQVVNKALDMDEYRDAL